MSTFQFPDSGEALLALWKQSLSLPFGKTVFSKGIGWAVPYTGSISPTVEVLDRGHAIVSIDDHRSVRNHLESIHAIALANIGEFSTGLAIISQLPQGMRVILGSIKVDYLKKARGHLRAEAKCEAIIAGPTKTDRVVKSEIFNAEGVCVCEVHATWVLGMAK